MGGAGSEQRTKDRVLLESLRFSLETGCCKILRHKVDLFGERLEASDDPAVRLGYAILLGEAEAAFRTESVHGQGSLLRTDHPVVRDLSGNGRPKSPVLIGQAEVDAATLYQMKQAFHEWGRRHCRG